MTKLEEILTKKEFNIQDVAYITKRKTQTIRSWEKKGIIPEADGRSDNRWRKYSKDCFIIVLKNILDYPWERQVIKNTDEVQYAIDVLNGKIENTEAE